MASFRPHRSLFLVIHFSLILLYPAISHAIFGISFDDWTVSSGAVDATCPTGVGVAKCELSVEDNGFLQRILIMDDGKRYIQRIVTDPGANGDPTQAAFTADSLSFAMEDFVEMNRDYKDSFYKDANAGITHKLTVSESKITGSIEDRFTYNVRFDNGPLFDAGPTVTNPAIDGWMNSTTTIREIDWSVLIDPVELLYMSATVKNNANHQQGYSERPEHLFEQRVNLGGLDSQQFNQHFLGGAAQTTSHTLADPFLLPGGSNGGNITWAAGDSISATWIGQSMTDAALPGTTSEVFGYTSYDKHTAGTSSTGDPTGSTKLFSLASADPASWIIDPFGPTPGLTAADPITAVA